MILFILCLETSFLEEYCTSTSKAVSSSNMEVAFPPKHVGTLARLYTVSSEDHNVRLKNAVFSDMTPSGSCMNRSFRGIYRLLHQGWKN
jgi:hypothetical protein